MFPSPPASAMLEHLTEPSCVLNSGLWLVHKGLSLHNARAVRPKITRENMLKILRK